MPWVDFDAALFGSGRLGIVAQAQLDSPDCATKMIGTGPFKLDHWTPNQELVVTKNPDYWQKDSKGTQLPYLDKITFKPVLEAAQRVNSFKSGQFTVIHTTNGQQITQLLPLANQFNLMQEKPGRREIRYYLMNTSKAPLDDPNARMAVAMAIDRNQINEVTNAGYNQIADGPFDKDVPGYMKNPGYPKFDLKKATELATAYKAAHGGQFTVVLEHTNDPANAEEAQVIQQQLAKAGIDATLKSEDQTAFIISAVTQNFSIMLWRNHPGEDPDTQYQWWNERRQHAAQLRQDQRPGAADAPRPGPLGAGSGEAHADLPAGEPGVRQAGLQRVGLLHPVAHRGAEERAGARGPAAARQGRQPALHLRPTPIARDLPHEVDTRHADDGAAAGPAGRRRHPRNAVHVQPAAPVPG